MKAIYVRQSVVKEDSISLDTQISECKKELKDGDTDFKVYQDRKSGKDTNREEFQMMLEDIKDGLIDTVIVYKVDRISRSTYDFTQIYKTFEEHKVKFISRNEKFDTSTGHGKAMLSIVMVFAELERQTIQMRINDNYYARGREGRYLGGKPPRGYLKVPFTMGGKKTYKYEENIKESGLIKEIFDRYVNDTSDDVNVSHGNIVKWLNTETEHKTSRGKGWKNNSISRIIRNPAYTFATADIYMYLKDKGYIMNNSVDDYIGENGLYAYTEGGKERKKDPDNPAESFITVAPHIPFINPQIWLRCQLKADKNKQIKNSGKGTHTWLSGLMKCGYCGYAVTVVNNGVRFKTICNGKKNHYCSGTTETIYIDEIEDHVEGELLSYLQNKISTSIEVTNEENSVENKEINKLNIQLIKIDSEIENLINAVASAGVSVAKHYNAKIEQLDKERDKITKQILSLKVDSQKDILSPEQIEECIENWVDYEFEEKKKIAHLFIKVITVTDDEIQIIFK